MGWSLGRPRIVVDHKRTITPKDDDYYYISGSTRIQLIYTHTDNYNNNLEHYKTKPYKFWKVRYYKQEKRWEISRKSGHTYIFGGGLTVAHGYHTQQNSIEWGVGWGNWIGQSSRPLDQQQFARVWDLAKVTDHWGNTITYHYQQDNEYVGGISSITRPYTQASYLKSITSPSGKRIVFEYGDKRGSSYQFPEYYDPHTEKSEADGYQEHYQTKYLKDIAVFRDQNSSNTLFTIQFSYNFFHLYTQPYTQKRILTNISQSQPSSETPSLPGLDFSYIDQYGINKGALKTITYPSGAKTTYHYASKHLSASKLNRLISEPAGYFGATPQVNVGSNYVVISWRKILSNAKDSVRIQAYRWDGRWREYKKTIAMEHPDERQTYVGKDFFVVLSHQGSLTSFKDYHIFHKKQNDTSGWVYQKERMYLDNSLCDLATGDDYFALVDNNDGRLKAYHWNGYSWEENTLVPAYQTNEDNQYFIGGANNYMVYDEQIEGQKDQFTIFYLNKNHQTWHSNTIPTSMTDLQSDIDSQYEKNYIYVDNSQFLVEAKDDDHGHLFRLAQDYTIDDLYLIPKVEHTAPVFSLNNTMVTINRKSFDSNTKKAYRWDGREWDGLGSFLDSDLLSFAPDLAIRKRNIQDTTQFQYKTYNASDASWSNTKYGYLPQAVNSDNPGIYPQAGNGFFVFGRYVYMRYSYGNYTAGIDTLTAAGYGHNGFTTLRTGRNFVVYQYAHDGKVYFDRVEQGRHFPNIQLDDFSNFNSSKTSMNDSVLYGESNLVGRSTIVTYENAITAHHLMLHRVVDGKVEGTPVDYPVSEIETDDGYQTSQLTLNYGARGMVDPSGQVAHYNKVTTHAPDNNGYTEYYFLNGADTLAEPYLNLYDTGREPMVRGYPYDTKVYNSNNQLVSETRREYTLKSKNIWYKTAKSYWARLKYTEQTKDNLTATTKLIYNDEDGLVSSKSTTNYDVDGRAYHHTTSYVRMWQYYNYYMEPEVNLLTPIAKTTETVNGTIVGITANKWKKDGDIMTPYATYRWKGTDTTAFSWTGGEPSDNWTKMSEISSYDPYGNITKTVDGEGVPTAHVWTQDSTKQGMDVTNALPGNVMLIAVAPGNFVTPSSGNGKIDKRLAPYNTGDGTVTYGQDAGRYHASSQMVNVTGLTSGSAGFSFDIGDKTAGESYKVEFDYKVSQGKMAVYDQQGDPLLSSGVTGKWQAARISWEVPDVSNNGKIEIRIPENGTGGSGNTTFSVDNIRVYPAHGEATSYGYNHNGQVETRKGPQNQITYYQYDRHHRLAATSTSAGAYTQYKQQYSRTHNGGSFNADDPNRATTIRYRGDGASDAVEGSLLMKGYDIQEFGNVASNDDPWKEIQQNADSADGAKYSGSMENYWHASYPAGIGITDPDNFTVTWQGQIYLDHADTYSFSLNVDNEGFIQLFVDGQWIRAATDDSYYPSQGNITYPIAVDHAGWYPIRMGLHEFSQAAKFVAEYQSASTPQQVIPASNLRYVPPARELSFTDGMGRTIEHQQRVDSIRYRVSDISYNKRGQKNKEWNPYLYDTRGHYDGDTTHVYDYYNSSANYRLYTQYTYTKSPLERKKTISPPDTVGSNANAITYDYGNSLLQDSTDYFEPGDPGLIRYAYTQVTYPNGRTDRTYRDRRGRTIRSVRNYGTADTMVTETEHYHYQDPPSRGTIVRPPYRQYEDDPPKSTYSKDFLGRTTSVHTADQGYRPDVYAYDDQGKLRLFQTSKQFLTDSTLYYNRYDSLGRPTAEGEAYIGGTRFYTLDPDQTHAFETDTTTLQHKQAYGKKPASGGFPWSLFATAIDTSSLQVNTPGQVSAEIYKTRRSYNKSGRWQLRLYGYNARGQVSEKQVYTQDAPQLATTEHFSYNRRGTLIGEHFSIGDDQHWYQYYGYNVAGQLAETYGSTTSQKPSAPDVSYTYTARGQLAARTVPGKPAASLSYRYDLQGRLDTLYNSTGSYGEGLEFNDNGNISNSSIHNLGGNLSYQYHRDIFGCMTKADQVPNNSYESDIDYRERGNIAEIYRTGANGNDVDYGIFLYNPGTNQIEESDNYGSYTEGWIKGSDSFIDYDYDGRRTSNPTSKVSLARYNNHGALLEAVTDSIGSTYGGVVADSVYISHYRYNIDGQRIYKHVVDSTGAVVTDERYIRDGHRLLAVTDAAGNVKFWNLRGNGLEGRYQNGHTAFYNKDHLGSVRQVVHSGGAPTGWMDYYPYGGVMRSGGQARATVPRFSGQQLDSFTGLYYFGARYYDPGLGSWMTPDPAGQFHSPYSYGAGRPLMYRDENGELFGIDDLIAGTIGATINLTVNLVKGNVHNIGEGFAAFGSGFAAGALATYGPAGWAAGGAIVGGTNAWLGGAHSVQSIATSSLVGGVSGLAGGYGGQLASEFGSTVINGVGVNSPALNGLVGGAFGGAGGGFAGGASSAALTGHNVLQGGLHGALSGAFIGGGAGAISASVQAYRYGRNPVTGRRLNPEFKTSLRNKLYEQEKSISKINETSKEVKKWLGKDYTVITNKAGDKIFLSKDGLRKIRFDFNRPYPHENPHIHLEKYTNGDWIDTRIYPKDVPNY